MSSRFLTMIGCALLLAALGCGGKDEARDSQPRLANPNDPAVRDLAPEGVANPGRPEAGKNQPKAKVD
jgi:hypothetical protein